jgi:hypothetical protein
MKIVLLIGQKTINFLNTSYAICWITKLALILETKVQMCSELSGLMLCYAKCLNLYLVMYYCFC